MAVTERVIWTLRHEWLFRVPLIKGFDHLERLCVDFKEWHNAWRPHMTLGGVRPDDVYGRDLPEPVTHDAKVVPLNIERWYFSSRRQVGWCEPEESPRVHRRHVHP
ncbi:integrase core domain-containing protein [Myxococcota bacterium]